MKSYGAIRKVMLIVLLSILGSYCIGAQDIHESNSFGAIIDSSYSVVLSFGSYCYKLYSELVHQLMTMLNSSQKLDVKIQNVDNSDDNKTHNGDNDKCTDGKDDCVYNEGFFLDTWFTGKLDMDPKSHLDPDTVPMKMVQD